MLALIYGRSGSGKTVNSTRVATKTRGKNLLLCSDNSHVVLNNHSRPNCVIETIDVYLPTKEKNGFVQQTKDALASQQYDNIIIDNITDIFDMAILDMEATGLYKDMRQAYQKVYQTLKRLVREATRAECDVIFTAWSETIDYYKPDGTVVRLTRPKLPEKILDNVLGLCNIVASVQKGKDKSGNSVWGYIYEATDTLQAKDQLFDRKTGMPESIFQGGDK